MRISVTIFFFLLGMSTLCAQSKSKFHGVSPKVYMSVFKPPVELPNLVIQNLNFKDTDGDSILRAKEDGIISFEIINNGPGEAKGLILHTKDSSNNQGLIYSKSKFIDDIEPGEIDTIDLNILSTYSLEEGMASFYLQVKEANGFGPDPVILDFKTEKYEEPLVRIVEYKVETEGDGILKKKEPFKLRVKVRNEGKGVAEDVSVLIEEPDNTWRKYGMKEVRWKKMESGQDSILEYGFTTNDFYSENTIPFIFKIEELNGYGIDTIIKVELNQDIYVERRKTIKGTRRQVSNSTSKMLTSDIDKNIPKAKKKYSNKVALIFGNENYSQTSSQESNVDYARNDAKTFKDYVINTLGLEEQNVFCTFDATAGNMRSQIGTVAGIVRNMGAETELIFYYAGHGHPDDNKIPYLVPTDVNQRTLTNLGIPLREIYQTLGNTGAQKITVVIDACFSGGGRNEGLIASSRGIRIKADAAQLFGNMVVFSASSSEQRSLPYHDQEHGMFTYFFLKKLQESKGMVTYGELDEFVKREVGIFSNRKEGIEQNPYTKASYSLQNKWKSLVF